MGCSPCQKRREALLAKSKSQQQTVTLTMPNGDVSEHGSRLEAQAANVRAGGGGKVRPKRS